MVLQAPPGPRRVVAPTHGGFMGVLSDHDADTPGEYPHA